MEGTSLNPFGLITTQSGLSFRQTDGPISSIERAHGLGCLAEPTWLRYLSNETL